MTSTSPDGRADEEEIPMDASVDTRNDAGTKSLESPDDTRTFPSGMVQVVRLGGHSIGRTALEPGWRWSECVKPIAGTERCQARHVGYQLSGTLRVEFEDGTGLVIKPGDAYVIRPGHDGWVEGDETVRSVEFESLADWAKPAE
jgi:hypothetical protein